MSSLGWRVLLFAALGFGVGCSSIRPMAPAPAGNSYRIQPGDALEWVLYQERAEEETPLNLVIQPDGKIMLPYLGSVQAAGRTPPELIEDIRERLKKVFTGPATPHISMNVFPSRVVQVLGFVIRPGQFPLTHTMRATDALALAGGVRPAFADPDGSVLIRRNGKEQKTHNVYFNAILESGDGRTNYVVEPGDIIYVPATPFRKAAFFVEDVLSPLHALIAPITAPVTAVIGF